VWAVSNKPRVEVADVKPYAPEHHRHGGVPPV
jgi:hypothetical protein